MVCLELGPPWAEGLIGTGTDRPVTPRQRWCKALDFPVFASLVVVPSQRLLVATVEACVMCLSGDNGDTLWNCVLESAVFSAPRVNVATNSVFVGCHDHHVYSMSLANGKQRWAVNLFDKVHATPCTTRVGGVGAIVCATTRGTVTVLNARNGQHMAAIHLPGEVFSSPQCRERGVYVGCRDNHLYRLNMTCL